jgi:hypothetical protein
MDFAGFYAVVAGLDFTLLVLWWWPCTSGSTLRAAETAYDRDRPDRAHDALARAVVPTWISPTWSGGTRRPAAHTAVGGHDANPTG